MSIWRNECPHGYKLRVLDSERPGFIQGIAPDCKLCKESGWTSMAYQEGPKQELVTSKDEPT